MGMNEGFGHRGEPGRRGRRGHRPYPGDGKGTGRPELPSGEPERNAKRDVHHAPRGHWNSGSPVASALLARGCSR